jgi:hypothetical protein
VDFSAIDAVAWFAICSWRQPWRRRQPAQAKAAWTGKAEGVNFSTRIAGIHGDRSHSLPRLATLRQAGVPRIAVPRRWHDAGVVSI